MRNTYCATAPNAPTAAKISQSSSDGVTQTNGLAKRDDDSRMRWLRPGEVPPLGNWMRAAGYDTHYIGKWHVSHADLQVDGKPLDTNTDDGAADVVHAFGPAERFTVDRGAFLEAVLEAYGCADRATVTCAISTPF